MTRNLIAFFFLILIGTANAQQLKPSGLSIIPQPLSVKEKAGKFLISPATKIITDVNNAALKSTGKLLSREIKRITGLNLPVVQEKYGSQHAIILTVQKADSLGKEGYRLSASPKQVVIKGLPAGVFYGSQTILQLLPTAPVNKKNIYIPAVEIIDMPRFGWRGMMLDVGRHFHPVAYIKRYIDYLAFHKLNTFHWHLVEDAGWRIEIKKYPRLTEIGAFRRGTQWGRSKQQFDNTPHGGYYTQEQVKDIVKYAAEKYITVIPEIEMPGHTLSSLAAYPEFSCTGGPFEVSDYWVRTHDIYCAGNEKTFEFLQDVLTEVAELFPSQIIHIGGDEAPKTRWKTCPRCQARIKQENLKDEHELQSYFIKRIENFLLTKNKRIIGWDEILEGGLAPNAAVMSWRGITGGIAAAKQKHDVVMTPTTYVYFDYPQGERALEGELAYGPLLTLEKVYSYEPVPAELTKEEAAYIKGVQANVWSEYIHSPERVEYMSFPRGAALAEIAWTDPKLKNWKSFTRRLENQYAHYQVQGINYARSAYNVQYTAVADSAAGKASITLKTNSYNPQIYYTTDGSEPGLNSMKYNQPFEIKFPATVRAVNYDEKKRISLTSKWVLDKDTFKKASKK